MILPIIALGAVLVTLEYLFPAGPLPRVHGWWGRVAIIQAFLFLVVFVGKCTWEHWFRGWSLFHLDGYFSPWLGGLVAYLVGSFVFYWWHRARHEADWLWVIFHQLHHSPRRVEAITAFYVHPAEMVSGSIMNVALVYLGLGLSPEACAWSSFYLSAIGFFYHVNLRTPEWVGWLVQRPEMHRVHHQRGRHTGNFSDLPIWDHLFGTYLSPETFSGRCGFRPEREAQFLRILAFRNVNGPRRRAESRKMSPVDLGRRPSYDASGGNA